MRATSPRRLLDRLRALPGVDVGGDRDVGAARHPRPAAALLHARGRAQRRDGQPDRALNNTVTPRLLRDDGDSAASQDATSPTFADAATPPQAIVNEEFVRRFVAGGEALGRRVQNRGIAPT